MRVRVVPLFALAVCAVVATPTVLADEAVTFTNGASMVVASHEYDAKTGMIRLDLGAGSSIKFPANMIDSITVSGKSVFSGSNIAVPNQTVAVDRASGVPAYTVASAPAGGSSPDNNAPGRVRSASERRRQLLDPEAQLMAAQQPPDTNPGTPAAGPVGQRIRMMGRQRDASVDDPPGTTPLANGNFNLNTAPAARRAYGELGPRGGSAAAPPPPPPPPETPQPSSGETQDPPPDDPGSDR